MDKLRSMQVFVAVVEHGSFTQAAEALAISPVMVGKHIAWLEQLLGARLLVRTTRKQSLTEIGRHYQQQCRAILAQIRAAEAGAETLRASARGMLSLTAPVTFGSTCLAPLVADYLALHPEVSVELNLNDRMVDLVEEGIDAAIRIGKLDDSSLVARPLRPYAIVVCASPAYLEKHGTPRMPADLAQHECLDFMQWDHQMHWRLNGETGRHDAQARASRFRSNNGQALRIAALHGFGIVMQAEILMAGDIAAGRLVPLLQDYMPPPRPMHLLYARDRQPTPKLTTFIDLILKRYGPAATPPPATLT